VDQSIQQEGRGSDMGGDQVANADHFVEGTNNDSPVCPHSQA